MNKSNIYWAGGEYRTKCVIGFERDGVINQYREGYCTTVDDFDPIPGSLEAVAKMRSMGHKLVVITDQGCIEQGIATQAQVEAVNQHMLTLFGDAGCRDIDMMYFSAGIQKNDIYVKPNVGMFKRCEREIKDIKFDQGYYVGHTINDLKAAAKIGAKPVLVRTGQGLKTEQALNRYTHRALKQKTQIFDDLASFVESLS
jgi:D-glycero-D-manno-heptose 1,7-bisphosphate phosphatase